jgi:hypothetical protein
VLARFAVTTAIAIATLGSRAGREARPAAEDEAVPLMLVFA